MTTTNKQKKKIKLKLQHCGSIKEFKRKVIKKRKSIIGWTSNGWQKNFTLYRRFELGMSLITNRKRDFEKGVKVRVTMEEI